MNRITILPGLILLLTAACIPVSTPAAPPELSGLAETPEEELTVTAMAESATVAPISTPLPAPGPDEPFDSAQDEPRSGGRLVVAVDGPVESLDPADAHDRPSAMVIRNIFDGLTAVTPEGKTVFELASTARMLDELTWNLSCE